MWICFVAKEIVFLFQNLIKNLQKMGKGKKRKLEPREKNNGEENEFNLPAKFLAKSHIRSNEKRLIVILHGAQLETVKVNKIHHLLSTMNSNLL